MELEADRAGANATHAGEHDGTEKLLIVGAAAHALGHGIQQGFTRRLFNEAYQRLDVGTHRRFGSGRVLHVSGAERGKVAEKGEIPGTCQSRTFENITPA